MDARSPFTGAKLLAVKRKLAKIKFPARGNTYWTVTARLAQKLRLTPDQAVWLAVELVHSTADRCGGALERVYAHDVHGDFCNGIARTEEVYPFLTRYAELKRVPDPVPAIAEEIGTGRVDPAELFASFARAVGVQSGYGALTNWLDCVGSVCVAGAATDTRAAFFDESRGLQRDHLVNLVRLYLDPGE